MQAENYYATYDGALVTVAPPGDPVGDNSWHLEFNTWPSGQAMQTGVTYPVHYDSTSTSSQAYMLIGYTWTCGNLTGAFHVDEFTAQLGTAEQGIDTLTTFTASFAAVCDQGKTGVLRGCVHYELADADDGGGG